MIKPKSACYYTQGKTFPTSRDRRGVRELANGFKRLGWDFEVCFKPDPKKEPLREVVVTSGWNRRPAPARYGVNHLVLDCGYLGDRRGSVMSLNLFGLNGLARNPEPIAGRGSSVKCEPWNEPNQKVLLVGQVPTDRALFQVVAHYRHWLDTVARQLIDSGFEVLFKPHPRKNIRPPKGSRLVKGSLDEVFNREKPSFCVGYSSNALLEGAVKGVFPVPGSPLAMTWDIRTRFTMEPNKADRSEWLDKVTSQQFNFKEMSSGYALEHVLQEI